MSQIPVLLQGGRENVTFTFVKNVSLCQSLPSTVIQVKARPVIAVDGDTTICVGGYFIFDTICGWHMDEFKPGCCHY